MSERPELMAAGWRLRRDAVIDLKAPLALGLDARRSVSRHPPAAPGAVVDEKIAGRVVLGKLPAVENSLMRTELRISPRCRNAVHVARHAHRATAAAELDLRILSDRSVADGGVVNIGDVREIEQIVEYEEIVATNMQTHFGAAPIRIGEAREADRARWVRQRRIPDPDGDELIALDDGVGFDADVARRLPGPEFSRIGRSQS